MQFLWPLDLVFLVFVPVLAAIYVLVQRRRQRFALRYASLSLVRQAVGSGPGVRRHIPPALFLLAFASMLVASARPVTLVTVPIEEGTVILAIDVSGSMRADDVKPTRMDAAKDAAKAFVEKRNENLRIGVVSFSDTASIVQAPTQDWDAVLAAIDRLQPQRGTAIGRGILSSLDALVEGGGEEDLPSAILNRPDQISPSASPSAKPVAGIFASASVVLLTDGQNNQFPPPLSIIDQATTRGVRVYTIGVGTPEGTILHIQGRAVRTFLDEDTLRKIADVTGAEYYNASNANDLRRIYENLSTHVVIKTEKTEVTALFTVLAAVVSLVGGALSLLWFNRLP